MLKELFSIAVTIEFLTRMEFIRGLAFFFLFSIVCSFNEEEEYADTPTNVHKYSFTSQMTTTTRIWISTTTTPRTTTTARTRTTTSASTSRPFNKVRGSDPFRRGPSFPVPSPLPVSTPTPTYRRSNLYHHSYPGPGISTSSHPDSSSAAGNLDRWWLDERSMGSLSNKIAAPIRLELDAARETLQTELRSGIQAMIQEFLNLKENVGEHTRSLDSRVVDAFRVLFTFSNNISDNNTTSSTGDAQHPVLAYLYAGKFYRTTSH